MSQDNEEKDDLQEQIDEVAAEQAAAEENQVEEPDNEDEAEWLAAKAAMEADAKGEGEEPKPEAEGEEGKAPAKEPEEPKPEAPPHDDDQPKAVPFPRFREVNEGLKTERDARTRAEQEAAYWKGVAEGRIPVKDEPKEPEPDPVVALEAEMDALAKRYEDGEIGAVDFQKENRRLTRDLLKAEAARDAKPEPKEPEFDQERYQQEIIEDPWVQDRFMEIAKANPWLEQPTPGLARGLKHDLQALDDRVYELAAAEGVEIKPRTKRGEVMHRAFLMAAAHEAGIPAKYGWKPPAKEPDPKPEQKRPAQPPGSPTADQRKAKADLRRQHPGDPTQAGSAGAPGYEPSTEDILAMDDEEFDALPESTKAKLRGDR